MSHTSLVVPRAPPMQVSGPHVSMGQPMLPSVLDHATPQLTGEQELKTRSLPTRCSHKPGRGGVAGSSGRGNNGHVCEEDGFFYSQPLMEEGVEVGEENLYGSTEDLSSGSSILEKLMVWGYYSDPEEDTNDDGDGTGEATLLPACPPYVFMFCLCLDFNYL